MLRPPLLTKSGWGRDGWTVQTTSSEYNLAGDHAKLNPFEFLDTLNWTGCRQFVGPKLVFTYLDFSSAWSQWKKTSTLPNDETIELKWHPGAQLACAIFIIIPEGWQPEWRCLIHSGEAWQTNADTKFLKALRNTPFKAFADRLQSKPLSTFVDVEKAQFFQT